LLSPDTGEFGIAKASSASYRTIVTAPFRLLPPIADALRAGRPIVALESSVLAQGLPVPANFRAFERMTRAVEQHGATHATTAVVRGTPQFGLDGEDLARFLARDGVIKVASRDLAVAMARGVDGATTVSATLTLCELVGIRVFATGGIGGVHEEPDYDESSDLVELARSSCIVVCAGAKSILDLDATMERLDTLGVAVVGYQCDELPGFFTAHTDIPLPARVESATEIAAIYRNMRAIGRSGALLVVQPPPPDVALPRDVVDRAVRGAHAQARIRGVRGSGVTPFLLAAVEKETEGRSLATNIGLLERNAALAAEIAVALSVSH
jgi:pseudouridine-5'-phosphate glycosidase